MVLTEWVKFEISIKTIRTHVCMCMNTFVVCGGKLACEPTHARKAQTASCKMRQWSAPSEPVGRVYARHSHVWGPKNFGGKLACEPTHARKAQTASCTMRQWSAPSEHVGGVYARFSDVWGSKRRFSAPHQSHRVFGGNWTCGPTCARKARAASCKMHKWSAPLEHMGGVYARSSHGWGSKRCFSAHNQLHRVFDGNSTCGPTCAQKVQATSCKMHQWSAPSEHVGGVYARFSAVWGSKRLILTGLCEHLWRGPELVWQPIYV